MLVATDSAGEGIDLQTHCHRLVNFDIPFNPSRLEQRIGRIDRYGQKHTPEIYHFSPAANGSTYAADPTSCPHRRRRSATSRRPRLGQPGHRRRDPGSLQPGGTGARQGHGRRRQRDHQRALAGGMELNARLTELCRTPTRARPRCTSTPATRRVVDTALRSPPAAADSESSERGHRRRGLRDPGARRPAGSPRCKGLDTRLNPGVLRPVTFDP